jgi:hypothetical protein
MSADRYKKEDPERAEAVLETIWRSMPDGRPTAREVIFQHKTLLMDVFRAVRGERD